MHELSNIHNRFDVTRDEARVICCGLREHKARLVEQIYHSHGDDPAAEQDITICDALLKVLESMWKD